MGALWKYIWKLAVCSIAIGLVIYDYTFCRRRCSALVDQLSKPSSRFLLGILAFLFATTIFEFGGLLAFGISSFGSIQEDYKDKTL